MTLKPMQKPKAGSPQLPIAPAPKYPLEPDFAKKKHSQALHQSTWMTVCEHCGFEILVPPTDTQSYRNHKRGITCRKNCELQEFNEQGYFTSPYWCEELAPVMKQGKFYRFYPETVAAWLRWQTVGGRKPADILKFRRDLKTFLAMTEEQRVNYLSGLVLEHVYKQEAGVSSLASTKASATPPFDDSDLPF
jgi:hypothetical protein